MKNEESNFKQLQKQLFKTKISEERARTEINDLFEAHDNLFKLTNPKQHGYNVVERKKKFVVRSYNKKLFEIPKNPNEVNA